VLGSPFELAFNAYAPRNGALPTGAPSGAQYPGSESQLTANSVRGAGAGAVGVGTGEAVVADELLLEALDSDAAELALEAEASADDNDAAALLIDA
jgi:hypothetical protein